MKEVGDWSSKWPRPHGSTTSDEDQAIIPEWALLLPELVEKIAGHVLSTTSGVDAYMDMRAVCPSWRSAITKPSPLAAVAGLRFRPQHWIMDDLKPDGQDDNDVRIFLHVPTGRFRRLRLPVLRDNILAGATDGLLVLRDKRPPHLARVFNPFTGDVLQFSAPLPQHFNKNIVYASVNGGTHSTLFLLRWGKVLWAAPTSDVFTEKHIDTYMISIVNFQGNIYCADRDGCVFKLVTPANQYCDADFVVVARVSPDVDVYKEGLDIHALHSYLVECAGELLLVRYLDQFPRVFRVDVKQKLLEVVNSLDGRTLFLGEEMCVLVDADNLPSIHGDCIYMLYFENKRYDRICVYKVRGNMVDFFSIKYILDRPFSPVQVLLRYCGFYS